MAKKKRARSSSFAVSYGRSQNESSDFLFLRKPCWRLWMNPCGVVCSLYCGVTNQVNCVVTVGCPPPTATFHLPPCQRQTIAHCFLSLTWCEAPPRWISRCTTPSDSQTELISGLVTHSRIRSTSTLSEKHAGAKAGREKARGVVANNTLGVERLMMLSYVLHRAETNIP